MIRVTDEDRARARARARAYIDGTLKTHAAFGYEPTASAREVERAVGRVAQATADLRGVAEARKEGRS